LWYSPRASTDLFTVAVNRASRVEEPLLEIKWVDSGKRSIFLGRFGEGRGGGNLYVSLADLCGSAGKLF